MGKGIYTYYKERLIEIGGNNKCLYLKNVTRRSAYDLGRIFEGRDAKVREFVEFRLIGRTFHSLLNLFELLFQRVKFPLRGRLSAFFRFP